MSRLVLRLHRLVLHAYPRTFRDEFGADMQRLLLDRHRYEGAPLGRLLLREMADAATAAPTMRWEQQMAQTTWCVVAVAIAAVVALTGGPALFVPLTVAGAAIATVVRRRSPMSRPLGEPRRWRAWALAAGVAALPGIVILATSDEELSEPLWFAMALSVLGGLGLLVAAASMAMADRPGPLAP